MNLNTELLQKNLCKLMCSEIRVIEKNKSLLRVETPFYFPDGDPYQIYIKEMSGGVIRLTDMGHTMMQLSYENDTDKFREGTRGILLNSIISEMFINEEGGEFY